VVNRPAHAYRHFDQSGRIGTVLKDPLNYARFTETLRAWSALRVSKPSRLLSWDSTNLLIENGKTLDEYARKYLQAAVARSNEELAPLGEPLMLNLGKHRWLSADREESYSDWLAWILQGMSGLAEILPLFGLRDADAGDPLGPAATVRREVKTQHGRTDIEVPIGTRGLLIIEVKVRSTGTELPLQLERYAQKVTERQIERPVLILLGTEAPDPSLPLHNFTFTGWRTVCQRLRQHACRAKESDLLRAAAILIFCGAVEQNLLGLSGEHRHLRSLATVNYLDEWRREV
jgi:hypothetical protein